MIFNSIKDIINDLNNRVEYYLINSIEYKDVNYIVSLIRSYLTEIKNLKEIDYFNVLIINDKIEIDICKDSVNQHIIIDLEVQVRKIKINKIKSSNSYINPFIKMFF